MPFAAILMANTALLNLLWLQLATHLFTRASPMLYINSIGHKVELRSYGNYLTDPAKSTSFYSLGVDTHIQKHTHTHLHESDF